MMLHLYQSGAFPKKLLNNVLTNSLLNVYIILTMKRFTSSFSIKQTPKETEAYQKAIKKIKGGGPIEYESTDKNKNEICNKIKTEKNIYKHQLDMINNC